MNAYFMYYWMHHIFWKPLTMLDRSRGWKWLLQQIYVFMEYYSSYYPVVVWVASSHLFEVYNKRICEAKNIFPFITTSLCPSMFMCVHICMYMFVCVKILSVCFRAPFSLIFILNANQKKRDNSYEYSPKKRTYCLFMHICF